MEAAAAAASDEEEVVWASSEESDGEDFLMRRSGAELSGDACCAGHCAGWLGSRCYAECHLPAGHLGECTCESHDAELAVHEAVAVGGQPSAQRLWQVVVTLADMGRAPAEGG